MATDNLFPEIKENSEEPGLAGVIQKISHRCIKCNKCFDECGFIRKYGKPKDIARNLKQPDIKILKTAFECSLCGLCESVCPVDLDPVSLFIEMRREAINRGKSILKKHTGLMTYEKVGTSKRYSWYGLPEGCDSIFFPGCTLPGTRPETTFKLYKYLKKIVPGIGIVLDCCTKSSHDLGRKKYFNSMLYEMKTWLRDQGIKNIYAACPNCYRVFKDYGKEFSIHTVYEIVAEKGVPGANKVSGEVTIHDPCAIRHEKSIHSHLRDLIRQTGLHITEMHHSGENTICCGEGGAAGNLSRKLSDGWINIRKEESKDLPVVTYCAGCVERLSKEMPSIHVLDLIFDPDKVMAGKEKISRPPFTYWNRLKLKKRLKNEEGIAVSRERDYSY